MPKVSSGTKRSSGGKRPNDKAGVARANAARSRRGAAAPTRRRAADSFAARVRNSGAYFAWAILVAIALLVLALLYAAGPLHAEPTPAESSIAQASDPMAAVKNVVDQVIAVFRDRSLSDAQRQAKLRSLAEQHIDFARMARSSIGYHWRSLTPDQRAQFVPLFTEFIEDVVLSQIQSYSVPKIRSQIHGTLINFVREQSYGPGYAKVFSTVLLQDRPNPVQVNYLVSRSDNDWKIYDITIDAISVIANYRNQFNRVINNQGYDKLVSILKEKSRTLGNSLGH